MTAEQSRTPAGNRGPRTNTQGKRSGAPHGTDLLGLAPPHAGLVTASGIDPKVVTSRGYRSIGQLELEELTGLGFAKAQRRAGLLIPVWNVHGENSTFQLRPDEPRMGATDKPIKYETPKGSANVLDAHPHVRHQLDDPSVPLWITEGIRKADSAVSRGLCCVALPGVWNWRGTNGKGGSTALPDWESVALKGRDVFVVFDSDVMTNPRVHTALGRLKAFLEGRGATVRLVVLPHGGGLFLDEKVGLDDYLHDGGTVEGLIELATDRIPTPDDGPPEEAPADWPVVEGFEIPSPWRANNEGIKRSKEGVLLAVAHSPVVITGRLVDEEGHEAVEISWLRDDTWRSRVFNRDVLFNTRKIIDLAAHGVAVTSGNARELATFLSDLEAANIGVLPRKTMTSRVGWLGDDFICGERDDVVLQCDGLEATFAAYRTEGSFDEWKAWAAKLEEHPRAALGIYAALASVLLRVFDVPPFFVDLAGETSKGKTTTLRVGASVWGSPDLVGSWDATAVAIETQVGAVDGLPVFLDETKRAGDPKKVAGIVYEVSQGVGRARGAKAGGLRPTLRWSTVVVSTGEQPLTTFTQDGGTRARVVELWGSPFEYECRRFVLELTAAMSRNFGHAGPAFVRALLDQQAEWDTWREQFERMADRLAAKATSVVGERRARYVALLRFAAGLAEQFGVMDWKPDRAWWDALLTNGAGEDDDDQPAVAFEAAWQWAATNPDKFWSQRRPERMEPRTGWHGRWSGRPDHDIYFRPQVLRQVLERDGHDYPSSVKAWADRGWLDKDGEGKNTKPIKLQGRSVRMVVMRSAAIQAVAGDASGSSPERRHLRAVGEAGA